MAVAVLAPAPARRRLRAAKEESAKDDHRRGNGGKERIGVVEAYKILKKIGQGGYGAVSMARHVESGEIVAIKSSLHAGAEGQAALLREAAMLAACAGNPAVVRLREVARGSVSDTSSDLHLVMEYVPGRSLYDVIGSRHRRGHPFSEPETRRAMAQLLAGVAAMHAHGVVHRDLKPGNVLVGAGDGRLKICDLGLATFVLAPPPTDDTTTAGPEGTPGYMAPELLLGEKDCGTPVDVWALGCIMADLVAGQPLFPEEDLCEQVISIVNLLGIPDDVSMMPLGVSEPSKLREMVPEKLLSPAGFDVLQGLLEYNPKDRLTAADALKMPWFAAQDD